MQVPEKSIGWYGIGGMSWVDFSKSLQLRALFQPAPEIILIHLGGNDLSTHSVRFIMNLIKKGVRYLRVAFPEAKLVWIDILQRLNWGVNQSSLGVIELKRCRLNRFGRGIIGNKGGTSLSIDIDSATPGFFMSDGVHLSDIGLEFYLNALSDFLIEHYK